MEGIKVGLSGDLYRGATAIGMQVPCTLSLTCVQDALRKNPLASKFKLEVNQFAADRAESIALSFDIPIEVVSRPHMGKDEWLITPLE